MKIRRKNMKFMRDILCERRFDRKIVPILTICILTGCSQTLTQNSYGLNQNKLLNGEEEAYAIRMYELLNNDKFHRGNNPKEEDIQFEEGFFESDIYKKWGLADRTEFTYEDKLYLQWLEDTADGWEHYKDALTDLSDYEKEHLKEMHEKYGWGRINLRKELEKEGEELEATGNAMLMLTEAVCGSEELDDRALIWLDNMASAFVFGIMQNQ
jgi:hypothetical protein